MWGSFPGLQGSRMTPVKIVGLLLIAAGVLALVYGSFSYTKETHKAELGPLKIQVAEKETVNVPQWAGIAAVVAGVVLLVIPKGK
jgi:drug/metabolite transporter (DMT)-like permease